MVVFFDIMDIDEPSKVRISTLEKLLIQVICSPRLLSETQFSFPTNIPWASPIEKLAEMLGLQYSLSHLDQFPDGNTT